jgi:hypothetical protein
MPLPVALRYLRRCGTAYLHAHRLRRGISTGVGLHTAHLRIGKSATSGLAGADGYPATSAAFFSLADARENIFTTFYCCAHHARRHRLAT